MNTWEGKTIEQEIEKTLTRLADLMRRAEAEGIGISSAHVYNLGNKYKPVIEVKHGIQEAADNLGRKVYRDYFKGWYYTFQHNGVEWQQEKRNVRKR